MRASIYRAHVREQHLPELASTDWLVLLLYVLGCIGLGLSMRSSIKNNLDYLQAGRSLSTWMCAIAFIAASLGAPEVLGMGAAGAAFGFRAALYFLLGGIPALLFVALFVIPLYYNSGAVTLPGYLGMRFDGKTRVLSAGMFIVMALVSAGIALFMVARILEAMRIFDRLFFTYGWPHEGIFLVCILLAAVPVLIYVLIAGLRGTIVSQLIQFVLFVAGFLPIVWVGLKGIGGWSGLKASLAALAPPALPHYTPAGIAAAALVMGFVLGAARWTTDYRVLQMAMAAKSADSARKIGILAAAARLAIPFLLVLPGAIAVSLPTPQSKTVVRNESGAIYHEISIVPRAISEGRGLVPALIDPATNNPRLDSAGHNLLDYGMAAPNMLTHFAVTGLLGLAIAALLACLMSGVASGIAAVGTVFACDLYQPLIDGGAKEGAAKERDAKDSANLLRPARWAVGVGVLLAVGVAFAVSAFSGKSADMFVSVWLAALALVFALLQAPQLATFALGIFNKRATGHGAFAGLVAGFAVALAHYAFTLPVGAQPGLQGGWLGVSYRYHGVTEELCCMALCSFAANLLVALAVSRFTSGRSANELKCLTYAPAAGKKPRSARKRPEMLAAGVILVTLVLALIFA